MRNQSTHGLQRFHCPLRAPRQIENKRPSPHAAHRPAQRGKRSLLASLASHPLSHPIQKPLTDSYGRFPRNIARSTPSPAGGHDESHLARQPNQEIFNLNGV